MAEKREDGEEDGVRDDRR
ncbi:unnamed protein product [Spirodela intermedia]|uniref:Uncharacterized protein n=1 Tax=Spirodela intermedia TaxID=51605 RepID=A0A7I8L5B0_SPIIN|nr:unnamed protein product [Spirodela intermedia]